MMQYKGYTGVAEIAFDTGMIYGRVVGLRDIITFQGHTVKEAEQAFHDSVDDYLDLGASRNEPPEKPFSGKFLVRISSELHRTLVEEAHARNVSLNALVEKTLSGAFPVRAREPQPRAKADRPKAAKSKGRAAAKTAGPS
jgi:predicted HicB family RNase H-like nuclease